ncbi:MAG TPA: NUDIX hydrolase [Anaerolineales bacterium]
MRFELIESNVLFQGRAFTIRRDRLRTPRGETRLDIVEHGGSVVLIPVDEDGKVYFVRQYRHAAGLELLELPAGVRQGDEPYEQCAARELREETGMAAASLERIGDFYLAPGYSTEFMAVFLATGLTPDPLPADEDEFLQVERLSLAEALEMARTGQVPDAKSLAALFLAGPKLASR